MRRLFILLVLSFVAPSLSFAGTAVVVHSSNASEFSAEIVRLIYLGKQKNFSSGGKIIALDQEDGSTVKKSFIKSIVNKSENQYAAYWAKLMFTGKGVKPTVASSDAEVVDLVSKNVNFIGYVDSSAVNDSVKVVATF